MLKPFTLRGIERVVGTIIQPTEEAWARFKARGVFHTVLGSSVPAPPDAVDYITPAKAALATMLGNGPDPANPAAFPNGMGDCVIAEDLHLAALRACNAGAPWIPTTDQAVAAYSAVTGFNPTDPTTDQGTDPLALLKWREAGNAYPDGSTLLAAIYVDASNETTLKQAIWLADGVMLWASLPDQWENEEDGGDVWDVAGPPNPTSGHGFAGASYAKNILLSEWGEDDPPVELTFSGAAKYCVPSAGGGAVALIGSNAFNRISQLCPAGTDLSGLEAYLRAIGSNA